jgi:hypothetical protein
MCGDIQAFLHQNFYRWLSERKSRLADWQTETKKALLEMK